MLKAGDKAPDFWLPDQDGKIVRLSDFAGQRVVVYFYPKDDTPGCTAEACSFRNSMSAIVKRGAAVLGISMDSPASHKNFTKKYSLNFKLLSDERGDVCRKWGAWGIKKMYGGQFEGIMRTTFIVDEKGYVKAVFENVDPMDHAVDVVEKLG